MLKLLQQRTKLSEQIGEAKRQHRAVVYAPDRERELIAHLTRLSRGNPPARALAAIYREIMSSSRATQGQAPIGLLRASSSAVLLPGRWCFGACDEFAPKKNWKELAQGLDSGALALALLTGEDLVRVLQTSGARRHFFKRLTIVGDFSSSLEAKRRPPPARRIFIVTPRGKGAALEANQILILIECKSTVNAVKSLLNSMPDRSIHAEKLSLRAQSARAGTVAELVRLTLAKSVDGIHAASQLLAARQSAGLTLSILGIYPGCEDYGG